MKEYIKKFTNNVNVKAQSSERESKIQKPCEHIKILNDSALSSNNFEIGAVST